MDILELGAIGELVGGVAVVASLLYVGLQVRQNARSVRTGTFADTADSFNRFNLALATDPGLGDIVQHGRASRDELEPSERFKFDHFQLGIFRIIETLFYQTGQGTAEADLWKAIHQTLQFEMRQPGVRAWWQSNPHGFTEGFTRYVKSVLETQHSQSGAGPRED